MILTQTAFLADYIKTQSVSDIWTAEHSCKQSCMNAIACVYMMVYR